MMSLDEMKSGLHELETDQLITLSAALTIVQSGAIDEVLPEVHSIIQARQSAERGDTNVHTRIIPVN